MALDLTRLPTSGFLKASNMTPAMAACLPRRPSVQQFLSAYGELQDWRTIAVGDLVLFRFSELFPNWNWGREPFTLAPGCHPALAMFPPRGFLVEAKRLVKEMFKGAPFLAVHLRMGDFGQFCRQSLELAYIKGRCYYGIKQMACCVTEAARRLGLRNLFVASNGYKKDIDPFIAYIKNFSQGSLEVQMHNEFSGDEVWIQQLAIPQDRSQLDLALSTLKKIIRTLSDVFMGHAASTFASDIKRLRTGLNTSSCNDSWVCNGEDEWTSHQERSVSSCRGV